MTYQEFQKRYTYDPKADRLGAGGFGKVFKAYDNVRDRHVAIKVAEVQPEHENIRLRREVELVAALPLHPNVAYYEECHTFNIGVGEYDYAVMQFYEQGDLAKLLKDGNLSREQLISVLTQTLDGLGFLHSQGIIHRDLKPQNILIVRRGDEFIPKITDFGISKVVEIDHSSVFGNSLAGGGTLAYASPEQLLSTTIRRNTDLWSFGVIAYRALTGQLPFNTGSHASTSEMGRRELISQICDGRMAGDLDDVGEPWQSLVRACLIVDPEQRVRNVDGCREILNGGAVAPQPSPGPDMEETRIDDARHEPAQSPTPPPPIPAKEQSPVSNGKSGGGKKRRWLWPALGAVVAALVAAALFVLRPTADEQYEKGEELSAAENYTEAFKWYQKAANRGHAEAQVYLGVMYLNGEGIAQDSVEAVRWFHKAADQGYAEGYTMLGMIYQIGVGVTKDDAEAIRFYSRGSELGSYLSSTELAAVYEYGKGVTQDYDEAARLYKLAIEQGSPYAANGLENLEAKIAEAERVRLAQEERDAKAAAAERARLAAEERARQLGGVVINGLTWATRNVGAKGQFVSSPTNYGNLYTFEGAQTACPAGWRLPTSKEFEALDASGNKWTTEGGVTGRRLGSGSNTVFLPAAGSHGSDGAVKYQGTNGYYWSSSKLDSTIGFGLNFGNDYVYPVYRCGNTFGFTVRCVRS